MQSRFHIKKRQILEQLDTPDDQYHDLSPKGSVDEPIRPLISDINRLGGLVTTSSCSGRVSVFLEGKKKNALVQDAETEDETSRAGPGGKGGGSWLFISHSPIEISEDTSSSYLMKMFGMPESSAERTQTTSVDFRYIHLKFEPMILHILTASLEDSQNVLTAALSAGFRESGAVSLNASKTGEINPMVAVRSTGYSFDAIIGFQDTNGNSVAMVDETYLQTVAVIANERFKINEERIARFRSALLEQYAPRPSTQAKPDWEDTETRRQRKREEGLARQQQLQAQLKPVPDSTSPHLIDNVDMDGPP